MLESKTYITPGKKEPEFIIVAPMYGTMTTPPRQRKAIKFTTNRRGHGEFTTSDKGLQTFLDNHEWMKTGRLLVIGAHVPEGEKSDTPVQQTGSEPQESSQETEPATEPEITVKRKAGRPKGT